MFTATLCGFQFGFHCAIIAGAILYLTSYFGWSAGQEGFAVGAIIMGGLIGALSGGGIAARLGEKQTLHWCAVFLSIATTLVAFSNTTEVFYLGRALQGIGIGIGTVVAPMYLAEIASPSKRGMIVCANQFAIPVGILVAYAVNYLFVSTENWRMMFAVGLIPSLIQIVGFFFSKNVPRHKRALGGPWKNLLDIKYKKPLILGLSLGIFQQITGFNAITYFMPKIFEASGILEASQAVLMTLGVGCISLIAAGISLYLVDKIGRRPLFIISLVGMIISLFMSGLVLYDLLPIPNSLLIFCFMLYVAAFIIGLGPIPWLIFAEIYPQAIRGHAMSLSLSMTWLFHYLVVVSFPIFIKALSATGVFFLYAFFGVIALIFICKRLPETKGLSLEEIEDKFKLQ